MILVVLQNAYDRGLYLRDGLTRDGGASSLPREQEKDLNGFLISKTKNM